MTTVGRGTLTRRTLLASGLGIAGATVLGGCTTRSDTSSSSITLPEQQALTPSPGRGVVTRKLTAQPATIDLGGPRVETWAYNDTLPGPVVRAKVGDLVRINLENRLPDDTSIHWHGIALQNAADGVPGLTQDPVPPGQDYLYEFVAPDPGTYFYHPHVGVQLDRAMYAPLIIDDPNEPGDYDHEWVVVLDDWIDGTGTTPDEVLKSFTGSSSGGATGSDMGGMDMGGTDMGGMDMGAEDSAYGDVTYPYFLVNGRVGAAPETFVAKAGQRVRIRIINAAADTIFTVAIGDHRLTVTHTDGFPVQPQKTRAFNIGMGERYDVVTTLKDGVFPLVARPLGKDGTAMALVRTGSGTAPDEASVLALPELDGPILTGADLSPAESARLPERGVGQYVDLTFAGQMSPYRWTINGAAYPQNDPVPISNGQRVSVNLTNKTMMTHPVHLHGHTFALPNGLRKDTVLLNPMQQLAVELQADNPGNWAAHCHNIYHAEAGMMAALVYAA